MKILDGYMLGADTQPTTSLHLTTAPPVAQTITLAGTKVLCGEAFREIVAERLDQVERRGFTIDHDLDRPAQVLIDNAIGRLMDARDQLNHTAAITQGDHAAVNLRIGAALAWAALDRVHAGGGAHPLVEG